MGGRRDRQPGASAGLWHDTALIGEGVRDIAQTGKPCHADRGYGVGTVGGAVSQPWLKLAEDISWGVRNSADPTCTGLPKERINRVIAHVRAPFPVLAQKAI